MKTSLLLKSSLLTLLLVWNTNSQILSKVVMTLSGPVQGTEINCNGQTATQYFGIPFAKPPVGELRFQRPQPVEPWTETLVADTRPPACIQYTEYPFPWYDFEDGKSEDCLYLNIWVPPPLFGNFDITRKPVMFWIYGGGFTLGSNRKPFYNGQALAAEGGVVVVMINYRMAAFGFLTSDTEEAPGNVGLYDMVEALKWVHDNIAAFGGDPNQVTLVGESAGSISVGLLCVSPLTQGLFTRVIMESGSPAHLSSENNTANIAKSQKLAEAVGCADQVITIYDDPEIVVACLKDVDAFELAKTLNSFHPTSTESFFPNYGDEILPENPRMALINGNFHNADVLIGNNHDEGGYQITSSDPDVFGFYGEKDPKLNKSHGESMIRNIFTNVENPDVVVQYYLESIQDDDYYQVREQVSTASGDHSLLCPTVYFAESYSQAGNRVYYYFFTHRPTSTPWANWMGVMHYEEVQFVFGVPMQKPEDYTSREVILSRRMINIWSSFAKYGNPGYTDWPLYSRENPTYMELDTGMELKYGLGPHKSNCDFLREYFGFV